MKKILWFSALSLLLNLSFSAQSVELPKYYQFPNKYLKGKFYNSYKNLLLVATAKQTDKRFKKSVVLMIDHDENGAIGFVINKPFGKFSLLRLINKAEDIDIDKRKLFKIKIPIFWGGPLDQNKIFILHSNDYKDRTTKKFFNISISKGNEILFEIAQKKGPKESIVIVGLSAWTVGQLDGEVEKGNWTFSEINNDLIFENKNEEKWLEAIKNQFLPL